MKQDIAIFGHQGFAREVADIALHLDYNPIHILHDNPNKKELKVERFIIESDLQKYKFSHFAIGVGDNLTRKRIALQYNTHCKFTNLVHPDSSIGLSSDLDLSVVQGTTICAGVRFTNHITLGSFDIFNLNATIGHDCSFGDYVNIAPGVNISGNVTINEAAYIGTGASILQGTPSCPLVIGKSCTVGAGAVVTKSCDSDSVYTGIPARKQL